MATQRKVKRRREELLAEIFKVAGEDMLKIAGLFGELANQEEVPTSRGSNASKDLLTMAEIKILKGAIDQHGYDAMDEYKKILPKRSEDVILNAIAILKAAKADDEKMKEDGDEEEEDKELDNRQAKKRKVDSTASTTTADTQAPKGSTAEGDKKKAEDAKKKKTNTSTEAKGKKEVSGTAPNATPPNKPNTPKSSSGGKAQPQQNAGKTAEKKKGK